MIERLLPTDTHILLPLLAELQSLSDDTLLHVGNLERRFDKLESEREGLRGRIKQQHRNLKQSLKPFIDAARVGRQKLDQTGVCKSAERADKLRKSAKLGRHSSKAACINGFASCIPPRATASDWGRRRGGCLCSGLKQSKRSP